MIDNSVDTLAVSIDKKKQAVTTQSQELEALEARLRQTEELLKEKASKSPPQRNGSGRNSPRRRTPLPANFGTPLNDGNERGPASPTSPLARFVPSGPSTTPGDSGEPGPLSGGDAQSDNVPSPVKQDGGDFVIVDRAGDDGKLDGAQEYSRKESHGLPQARNRPPPPPSGH
ncbi:hypothetical protein FGG08_001023 [Glutinoglossum americanum]|uniref:Uncharacterized protein n=1 Tax=Glutinoglossum americanum TaxID=1670608 RepID=A0A9P8I7Q2_9PEZI|nr:hypothetical protein FGG08_001023 [Glutinoglossum americanum]